MEELNIILSTCSTDKEAEKIATHLVKNKLAACVNIIPAKSVYSWEGKIHKEKEYVMIIKTNSLRSRAAMKEIKRSHSYDEPEIVLLTADEVGQNYFKWVSTVTSL